MSPEGAPFEGESRYEIAPRDAEVVRVIGEEGLSQFSFDGLRRLTGAHPETLSRTLERLEDGGVLIRSLDGYVVADRSMVFASHKSEEGQGRQVPILHTLIPYGASASEVAAALKGRWFDVVRWVGMSETEDGLIMKWVTEDGASLIGLRIFGGQLDIDAKISNDADLPTAIRAAHQVLARISKLYASLRPGRAALPRAGYYPQAM